MFGLGDMGEILKKAGELQSKLKKIQKELKNKTVEGTSGGGLVVVVANGAKQILKVTIDKELINRGDIKMLQDLIVSATNDALNKAQEMIEEETKEITHGLNLPGIF
jgi:DNA-binding YbaB/EbfC family protein